MCNCQDIYFPTDEETSHISGNIATVTERIPVYIPDKCPENMLLYPGAGNKSVWICDCRPRFLYFPLSHRCHEAYRQGPCDKGEYVVLPSDDVVPKCKVNPCGEDGLVNYNGVCYYLRTKGGPCAPDGVLGVNETTYEIQCISTDAAPFVIINVPQISCPPGSRRNSLGVCKKPL
ncbi:uncharacterized protein LOC130675788 [Microplitis mediator]|uniref:uncharacterized protein LOC130675788 n=1 Tax=Microplitis mediator TaxID=375433 RepID=UPI002554A706|nr:uncharacterized protein LOC130675788 [Microplitis mediator]